MKAGSHEIPRRPLLWLTLGLVFTVPPMLGTLAPWVTGCFAASLAAKFWMERRGWRLRSIVWKIALAGAAFGGVELTYHALRGLEPGLSLLLLLMSVKILEAHTARDFHILALLGWVLCLAGLFISQDLSEGIYAVVAFMLILAAVAQFHRGAASRRPVSGPLLTSLGLVLRASPFVIVLFFLFPRGSPFQFDLRRPFSGRTGMANDLKPGSISSLAISNEVAFRAEFPDGNMPPPSDLYWRASVFTHARGLEWSLSIMDVKPRDADASEHLVPVRQRIMLQPHGGRWVFALGWPSVAPRGTHMYPGNVLRSDRSIFSQWQYETTSFSVNRESQLDPEERSNCLQLPRQISPQIRGLVQSWMQHSADPHSIVLSALQYFHKEKFLYTLTPGQYDERDGLDDFLFRRRSGFCEHYAAAFAMLMRVAGIPSRVVTGYYGGQFNALGKYVVVHQSDAHAWCEVWLPGTGWQRADPTASVAQGQMDAGFVDMRAGSGAAEDAASQLAAAWGRQPFLRNIRLAWDAVSYVWDSRVASFDQETQQSLFLGLGWPDTSALRFFAWLALAAASVLGAQSLWTWWRSRVTGDPLKKWYERFCRRVAMRGVKREPWEGPSGYAERAAGLLPAHATHIRRVAALYVSLRYSAPPAPAEQARALREFRRLARV